MIWSLFPVRNMAGFLSLRRHQAVTGLFSSRLSLIACLAASTALPMSGAPCGLVSGEPLSVDVVHVVTVVLEPGAENSPQPQGRGSCEVSCFRLPTLRGVHCHFQFLHGETEASLRLVNLLF